MVRIILQETLDNRGITRYQLSKMTNIDNNTLGKWCNGDAKQVSLESLTKICKALDCDITDIIRYE